MKRFLTTWALAAALLGARGTTGAMPTLFDRVNITEPHDWILGPPGSGPALSRLWTRPDDSGSREGEFRLWERGLQPVSLPDWNSFDDLLTDFANSHSLDNSAATFSDKPGKDTSGLPHNMAATTIRSLHAGDAGIATQSPRSLLMAHNPGPRSYDTIWQDVEVTHDAGQVNISAKSGPVDLILPVTAILFAGIAAGFVGWIGTRRILPPPYMSDI